MLIQPGRRLLAWTLIPPLIYVFASTLLLRFEMGRTWDQMSIPGAAIALLFGWSGGFEAGLVVATALNLAVFSAAGLLAALQQKIVHSAIFFMILPTGLGLAYPYLKDTHAARQRQRAAQSAERQAALERDPAYRTERAQEHFQAGVRAWSRCFPKKSETLIQIGTCAEWKRSIRDFEKALSYASDSQNIVRCKSHLHLAALKTGAAQWSASNAESHFKRWSDCRMTTPQSETALVNFHKEHLERAKTIERNFVRIR